MRSDCRASGSARHGRQARSKPPSRRARQGRSRSACSAVGATVLSRSPRALQRASRSRGVGSGARIILGGELLDAAGQAALRETLLPRTTLLTLNIPEAAALLGTPRARSEDELLRQAEALLALGPRAVLLKGGHGEGALAVDLLLIGAEGLQRLSAPRCDATRRGTGCAPSSAIAAGLAARCASRGVRTRQTLRDNAVAAAGPTPTNITVGAGRQRAHFLGRARQPTVSSLALR